MPIYVLDSVGDFMYYCCKQGSTNNYGGTYIDCIVSADEQKEVKEKDDMGRYFYCTPLKDNIYHITYSCSRRKRLSNLIYKNTTTALNSERWLVVFCKTYYSSWGTMVVFSLPMR